MMRKHIFTVVMLSCIFFVESKAQQYVQDISGSPITEKGLSEVAGSPYFKDSFLKGSIVLVNKTKYENLFLKVDELNEKLIYRKTMDDVSMEALQKVSNFSVQLPNLEQVEFINLGKENLNDFYQVLVTGKMALLKKNKKSLLETVAYNSKSSEKYIKSSQEYYVLDSQNKLTSIKKSEKDFANNFSDKKNEILNYISKQKVNSKKEEDLIKLVKYYNSL